MARKLRKNVSLKNSNAIGAPGPCYIRNIHPSWVWVIIQERTKDTNTRLPRQYMKLPIILTPVSGLDPGHRRKQT